METWRFGPTGQNGQAEIWTDWQAALSSLGNALRSDIADYFDCEIERLREDIEEARDDINSGDYDTEEKRDLREDIADYKEELQGYGEELADWQEEVERFGFVRSLDQLPIPRPKVTMGNFVPPDVPPFVPKAKPSFNPPPRPVEPANWIRQAKRTLGPRFSPWPWVTMGAAGIATALLVPVVVVWTTVLVAIGALGLVTASFIYRLRSRRVADLIGRAKKQFAVLVEEHERSMARYTAAWESKKAEVDAVNAIGLREWTAGRDLEVEVAQTAWQKVKTRQESLVQRFEAGIQSYEPESVFWVIGEILRKLDCPIPLFAEVDSEDFVTISIRYALPNVESLPQYGAKRTAAGNYGIRDASASHRKKLLSALGAGLALQLAATIFRHIPRCGEVQLEGIVGHHRLALKSPLPGLALRATRDGFSFAIAKSNDPAAVLKQLGGRMRLDKEGVPYPVCLTSSATAFGIDVEFKRLGTTSKKKTCLVCGATFEDNGAEDAHLFDARGLCRAETIYIHGACSPLRKRDKGQSRRERSEALQGQSATLVVKHSAMG